MHAARSGPRSAAHGNVTVSVEGTGPELPTSTLKVALTGLPFTFALTVMLNVPSGRPIVVLSPATLANGYVLSAQAGVGSVTVTWRSVTGPPASCPLMGNG